jgi:2,4-diketo-3-deoxy-L-fuconate hydrolase
MHVGNLCGRLSLFTEQGAVDIERASGGRFGADPQAVYERWHEFTEWMSSYRGSDAAEVFDSRDLGAPAPRPRQVFAISVNYRAHATEEADPAIQRHAAKGVLDIPASPSAFCKWPSSFTGPFCDIVLAGPTVDWETELVAILGKRASNVPVERGWEYIAGLTVGQDISERTRQLQGAYPQVGLAKSFPGFSPTGPWLVTLDEFEDPDDLELGCTVNGKQMQKARTSELVFSVPALVAELSKVVTLEPGDVIFTGTPGGVGVGRRPPVYLAEGDVLVTTVQGIGEMRHRFVST